MISHLSRSELTARKLAGQPGKFLLQSIDGRPEQAFEAGNPHEGAASNLPLVGGDYRLISDFVAFLMPGDCSAFNTC